MLLFMTMTLLSCDKGEQEIIIVPKGYRGYLVIIFNQKDGVVEKYDGKKRVYEMPENGVLKTQFKGNYGLREFTEFYYEKISPENKISSFAEFRNIPPDSVVGLIGPNGTVKKAADSEERIEFVEFYVGTKQDIEQAKKQVERLGIIKLME